MKKLIGNFGTIIFGILASAMCFVPMFDLITKINKKEIWADGNFSIFSKVPDEITNLFNLKTEGWQGTFKIVSAIIAGLAILCVVTLIAIFIVQMVNKKIKIKKLKFIVTIILLAVSILLLISTIIFMTSNSTTVTAIKTTYKITISNWFAYLSVIIGFILSALCSLLTLADSKK